MKILWGATLSVSAIFIVQSVLTFIGAGSDMDMDFDADLSVSDLGDGSTGMGLLTFRNFINFCLGALWSAVLLRNSVASTGLLIIISIFVGIALVVMVMLLFRWLGSMQQSGNIDVFKAAVGCEGKAYLRIPASREGTGKVQISINNSVRDYDALTDGPAIPTGKSIRVKDVINSETLLVEENK